MDQKYEKLTYVKLSFTYTFHWLTDISLYTAADMQ